MWTPIYEQAKKMATSAGQAGTLFWTGHAFGVPTVSPTQKKIRVFPGGGGA